MSEPEYHPCKNPKDGYKPAEWDDKYESWAILGPHCWHEIAYCPACGEKV